MKYLAKINNIHIDIDGLVRRKSIKETLDLATSLPREFRSKRSRWTRLPFRGKFSTGLSKILKSNGFRLGFYNNILISVIIYVN